MSTKALRALWTVGSLVASKRFHLRRACLNSVVCVVAISSPLVCPFLYISFSLYNRLEERIAGFEAALAGSAAEKEEVKERLDAMVVRWKVRDKLV